MDQTFKTFAFFDLETTGLPQLEFNRTKITQLSIVSCSVEHIQNLKGIDSTPRVIHKLSLCFNPHKLIKFDAEEITGLSNDLLEHESRFDERTVDLITNYLAHLQQPVMLVAHNGRRFDFPILKKHLNAVGRSLSETILCCDSIEVFRKIDETYQQNSKTLINGFKMTSWEKIKTNTLVSMDAEILQIQALMENYHSDDDEDENDDNQLTITQLEENFIKCEPKTEEEDDDKDIFDNELKLRQLLNETTPNKPTKNVEIKNGLPTKSPEFNDQGKRPRSNISRELFPQSSSSSSSSSTNSSPKQSPKNANVTKKWPKGKYTLREIYKRYFNNYPEVSHDAESDVIALMKCVCACKKEFIEVANAITYLFCDVKEL